MRMMKASACHVPPTVVVQAANNAGCNTSEASVLSFEAMSTTRGTLLTTLEPTTIKTVNNTIPEGFDALSAGSNLHQILAGTCVRVRP